MWQVTIANGVLFVGLMVVLAVAAIGFALYILRNSVDSDREELTFWGVFFLSLSLGGIFIYCIVERGQTVTLLSGGFIDLPTVAAVGIIISLILTGRGSGRPDKDAVDWGRRRRNIAWTMSVGVLVWKSVLWMAGDFASYEKYRLCDEESDRLETNNANAQTITQFEVKVKEGCWGGWITPPLWWPEVVIQNRNPSGWWAVWYSNAVPLGPFRSSQEPPKLPVNWQFRLQGSGKVLVWTNVNARPLPNQTKREPPQEQKHENPAKETPPVAAVAAPVEVPPAPKPPSSPPGTAKRLGDFLYTLGACQLSADYLVCTLNITNKGTADRSNLIATWSSRIIDSANREHRAVKSSLGADSCDSRSCNARADIPPDVTMMATVGFETIPTNMPEIQLLEVMTDSNTKVKFYGVPIVK